MDLTPVKDVLHDYFRLELPDEFLIEVLNSDEELQREYNAGAIYDTCVRDLLINVIGERLGVEVNIPNMFGEIGSSEWPMYGDSNEYTIEYFTQLNDKVHSVGGKFIESN